MSASDAPNPLATAADVSEEMGGALSPADINDRWLKRASHVVQNRVPDADDWLQEELEILVAAHFAFPHITGATEGKEVSSVTEGQAQISYESTEGPDGNASPYWTAAVKLSEGRLDDESGFFSVTL